MKYLHRIQRGIDFIEKNLDERFEIADVARHAGLSHWHFQRIFKALTNDTLKGYIRSRRLSTALVALHGQTPILEIAIASGFESQAAFTRAFKASFGTTPAKYRALGKRTEFVRKLRLDEDYLRHLQVNVSLAPVMVERPALTLVGLRTSYFGVDSDKSNLGDKLPALWGALLQRVDEIQNADMTVLLGAVIPAAGREQLDYLAGAVVEGSPRIPKGMVKVSVPSATYAEFRHKGLPAKLNQTVNYVYGSWLLASDWRHTYGPDLELYGEDYIPNSRDSVIRYAIPVKAKAAR